MHMSRLATRAGVALAVSVATLFSLVAPASATIHPFNIELTDGTITVDTTDFVTPGTTPATCPGSTAIHGTINDAGTSDDVEATLNIQSGDFAAPFTTGRYVLTATGSATGSNRGHYDPSSHTFWDLHFPTITFTVRSINTTTCAPGAVVCSGTATLTLEGGEVDPDSSSLNVSDEVYINSTAGQILTTSGCTFPWWVVVYPGAALAIGPNTNGLGAIFHVTSTTSTG